MNLWTRWPVLIAAAVVALAAGTATFAMYGGDARQGDDAARSEPTPTVYAISLTPGAGSVSPFTCATGRPDCIDKVVMPPELTCEEARACAAEPQPSCAWAVAVCDDTHAGCSMGLDVACPTEPCPPGVACKIFPAPTPYCAAETPPDVCFPNARPAGPLECDLPQDAVPTCVPPCVTPQGDREMQPGACPPRPCAAGTAGCGCLVQPPLPRGGQPAPGLLPVCKPLPPDCAISSDGMITCPDLPPEPCADGGAPVVPDAPSTGCSVPGAPPLPPIAGGTAEAFDAFGGSAGPAVTAVPASAVR